MSIPSITDRLEAATAKAEGASQIMHDVANGGPLVEVPTESGPVPSIQRWYADLNDRTSGAVGQVQEALDQVQEALDQEVLARQQLGIRVDGAVLSFPDLAAAEAAAATLPDGQEIEAPNADGRLSRFTAHSGALVFKDFAPDAIQLGTYNDLRSYAGARKAVDVTKLGISGRFYCIGTISGATDNGVTRIIDSMNRVWMRAFAGYVYLAWGDGVFDGNTDDTEAIRRVFSAANETRTPVSYVGVQTIGVDANARIQVNVPIFPGTCRIKVLNGYVPISDWTDDRKIMFIINDPDTPLVSVTVPTATPENYRKGSVAYFETLGTGYIHAVFPGFQVPYRDDSNTRSIHMPAFLNNGVSDLPLFTDLSSLLAGATAQMRRNSYGVIDLGDVNVDLNGANNQTIYHITRNGVKVGLRWIKPAWTTQNSCCSLIKVEDAGEVEVRELQGDAMDGATVATYCLHLSGASSVEVNDMWCSHGWAHMGTNRVSNVTLRNSRIYRYDLHEDGFDMRAYDCTFYTNIQYGLGGGNWEFERIKIAAEPGRSTYRLVTPRADYGRSFYGSISLKGIEMNAPDDSYMSVLYFAGMGSSVMQISMPDVITLDGLTINLSPTTTGNPTRVIRLYEFSRTKGTIVSPTLVDIKNVHINCARDTTALISVNPASTVKPSQEGATLRAKNITSSRKLALTISAPDANYLASGVWYNIDIQGMGAGVELLADWRDQVIRKFVVDDANLVKSFVITKWPSIFMMSRCLIDYTDVASKTFGPVSAYRSYTNYLRDCIVNGDPNLTTMNAMSGVLVRQYQTDGSTAITSAPTLPSGATLDNIFTGWKSSSVYK